MNVIAAFKWDLSITISAIIAIAAVVSPILTSIINNAHQTKIEKMELKQEHYEKIVVHQKSIFENYLRNAGRHIGDNCLHHTSKEYYDAYFLALSIAPPELQNSMRTANNYIEPGQSDTIVPVFEQLIPEIQKHIEQL